MNPKVSCHLRSALAFSFYETKAPANKQTSRQQIPSHATSTFSITCFQSVGISSSSLNLTQVSTFCTVLIPATHWSPREVCDVYQLLRSPSPSARCASPTRRCSTFSSSVPSRSIRASRAGKRPETPSQMRWMSPSCKKEDRRFVPSQRFGDVLRSFGRRPTSAFASALWVAGERCK